MAPKIENKRHRESSQRSSEIEAVIRELAAARGAGQKVDYSAVVRAHPDLLPELGERIRRLQAIENAAACQNAPSLVKDNAGSASGNEDPDLQFLRDSLDGYEILRRFDYGGQGRVFKAVQSATNRSVAIKILLDGPLATQRHHDRFTREIELVSRVKHPGIVTVYDSGVIRGRQYLVMEFVDGLPIDDYVLLERPDVCDRVRLFLEVCRAVSVAHRHGIIHRDLKPANILVDGDGRAHVLDFGLAKELQNRSFAGGLDSISDTGQIIGTLWYLSPEQAWGHSDKIDTRSDVYGLGVVLFELITGLPPYPTTGTRDDVLRRIRHEEPAGLRKTISMFGHDGIVETKHIGRDLEIIVARCLEKEPERRYQSVLGLSEDLERYLRGDAIEARAASSIYVLRKTIRKFRIHVTIALVFLMLILGALGGMTVLWKRAETTARIAQTGLAMGSFVRRASVHRDARELDQAIAMLQRAVELSEFVSTDDPLVRRQIYSAHHNLAELYFKTDRLAEASRHCDEALELSEAFRREDSNDLEWIRLAGYSHKLRGRLAYAQQEWDKALNHFEEMLAVRQQVAEREPEVPYRQVELVDAHVWVGKAARRTGRLDEAVRHFMAAHAIGEDQLENEPGMVDHAIRLSRTETNLGAAYMSYKTNDGHARAIEWFELARKRLTELQNGSDLQERSRDVADILGAIDGNIARLYARRAASSTESNP